MENKQKSLGTLGRMPDTLLLKTFSFFEPVDLVRCSRSSWMFYVVSNTEELWRYLVLLLCVDEDTKVSFFTFKGSWKATMLLPKRLGDTPGTPTANKLWMKQNVRDHQVALHAQAGGDPAVLHANRIRCSGQVNYITQKGQVLQPPSWAAIRQKESFRWYNVRGMDLGKLPMFLGGVERRRNLSVEAFIEEYEKPNKPVVLTGMIDHWRAMQSWRFDNFVAKYKDVPFKTNGRSSDGRRFRMKMFDFMAYCQGWNGEKPLYIFDKKIFGKIPDLEADYEVPPMFAKERDLFELMDEDDRPDYRWILIGPNGSGSPLHTDPHNSSAWNAVIEGCKRVTLYPPDVIPPGVDEELIHSDYYASDDTMDWYRNTLPDLDDDERPVEVLVQPGEVLFIPSGWWHTVQNIGHTIAVTQNFCSTVTFPRVAGDMNAWGGRSIRKDFKLALRDSPEYAHLADAIDTRRRNKST